MMIAALLQWRLTLAIVASIARIAACSLMKPPFGLLTLVAALYAGGRVGRLLNTPLAIAFAGPVFFACGSLRPRDVTPCV